MANQLTVPQGGGALPPIGTPYAAVGPTSVPDFSTLLADIFKTLPGQGKTPGMPSFQGALDQGMNSPIFQSIIKPALSNLLPGEEMARSALMDEFRSAGGLGSGAMGVASSRLENSLQGQRGNLISQVLSNFLPNLVSGYGLQSKQAMSIPDLLAQVLGINKPSIVTGQGGGVSSGGGGGSNPNPFGGPSATQDPNFNMGSGGGNPFAAQQYGGAGGNSGDPLAQYYLNSWGGGGSGLATGQSPGSPTGYELNYGPWMDS